ncbi:ArsA-related P-loop ATPase [Marihabitans asiaticum]|uniref:Arsenite efflux ATP-binding protein ArsA n=1 Tax=Marihabitans asiaticum TaxID=415218 RepID=A0A560WDN2_9MICO|nr:ArsA-related P-loop ATPase [Marihabitans asiaticum]TWD15748.1 arsenite efflux ATP-binding protein ArsA [Marihabitans asiaticum]
MRTRLHVVTGKGGTGKTTASAALAVALARRGRQVVAMEVEGRDGLAGVFGLDGEGVSAARRGELAVDTDLGADSAGSVHITAVDPRAALAEYLRRTVRVPGAASVLDSVGAVDFATTVAPGVRDVIVLGKVYDILRRPERGRGRSGRGARGVQGREYDDVVLDAPPTGRVGRFLDAPVQVAELARVGPIRSQADAVSQVFRRAGSQVHVVTVLEELAVQETIEAVEELRALGIPLGSLLVNQVEEPVLRATRWDEARSMTAPALTRECARHGLRLDDGASQALLDQLATRVALDADRSARLRRLEQTGLGLTSLRRVPESLTPSELGALAEDLRGLA